jgi:hypothetical protein
VHHLVIFSVSAIAIIVTFWHDKESHSAPACRLLPRCSRVHLMMMMSQKVFSSIFIQCLFSILSCYFYRSALTWQMWKRENVSHLIITRVRLLCSSNTPDFHRFSFTQIRTHTHTRTNLSSSHHHHQQRVCVAINSLLMFLSLSLLIKILDICAMI